MQARRHLSYANVMSTLAVVLALVGGSTAVSIAGKKNSKVAPKNSVTSKSIRNGSIQAADLAPRSVSSKAIVDGAVAAAELAPLRVASASNGTAPSR